METTTTDRIVCEYCPSRPPFKNQSSLRQHQYKFHRDKYEFAKVHKKRRESTPNDETSSDDGLEIVIPKADSTKPTNPNPFPVMCNNCLSVDMSYGPGEGEKPSGKVFFGIETDSLFALRRFGALQNGIREQSRVYYASTLAEPSPITMKSHFETRLSTLREIFQGDENSIKTRMISHMTEEIRNANPQVMHNCGKLLYNQWEHNRLRTAAAGTVASWGLHVLKNGHDMENKYKAFHNEIIADLDNITTKAEVDRAVAFAEFMLAKARHKQMLLYQPSADAKLLYNCFTAAIENLQMQSILPDSLDV